MHTHAYTTCFFSRLYAAATYFYYIFFMYNHGARGPPHFPRGYVSRVKPCSRRVNPCQDISILIFSFDMPFSQGRERACKRLRNNGRPGKIGFCLHSRSPRLPAAHHHIINASLYVAIHHCAPAGAFHIRRR